VSDDNVIPFRKRRPSKNELEVYRHVTRNWHPQMRELVFPEHSRHDDGAKGTAPTDRQTPRR
jgi:hypothetical protein